MSGAATDWPAVSAIVLAYNHEDYVAASIRSIAAIDYPRLEGHVLDDGSRDGTFARAQQAAAAAPFPISVETQAHSGRTAVNSNRLLARARGEYVLFLAGDDALAPGYGLRALVAKLRADPNLALILPRAIHVHMGDSTRQTSIYTPEFAALLRSGDPGRVWREHLCRRVSRLFLQGALMPRAACAAFGGFDDALLADDYAFMMRAFDWMQRAGKSFLFAEDELWLYRVHPRNVHADAARQRRLAFEVVAKYVPSEHWPAFQWDHEEPIGFAEMQDLCAEIAGHFGAAGARALTPPVIRRFCYRALARRDVGALMQALRSDATRAIAAPFVLPRLYRLLMPR